MRSKTFSGEEAGEASAMRRRESQSETENDS